MEFLNETTYVDQAGEILEAMTRKYIDRNGKEKTPTIVSTSKIRNILSMAADIYDNVLQNPSKELNESLAARVEYLRVRMVYESGREPKVKDFISKTHLLEYVQMIKGDKQRYILFYRYLEALVAFHRYYGGKD